MESPWLTSKEVAAYRRCHINTVMKALRSGALKGVQPVPNGQWLIHRDALEAWLPTKAAA